MNEKTNSTKRKAGGGLLIIAMIILVILGITASQPTDRDLACSYAQEKVSESLLDPGSAEFEDCEKFSITEKENNEYSVRSTVRSKNAFGVKIRKSFICNVTNFEKTGTFFGDCKIL